jgi:hypothetical protein
MKLSITLALLSSTPVNHSAHAEAPMTPSSNVGQAAQSGGKSTAPTAGQTLIVTSGVGWIQEWGVKHWHGATATSPMVGPYDPAPCTLRLYASLGVRNHSCRRAFSGIVGK